MSFTELSDCGMTQAQFKKKNKEEGKKKWESIILNLSKRNGRINGINSMLLRRKTARTR